MFTILNWSPITDSFSAIGTQYSRARPSADIQQGRFVCCVSKTEESFERLNAGDCSTAWIGWRLTHCRQEGKAWGLYAQSWELVETGATLLLKVIEAISCGLNVDKNKKWVTVFFVFFFSPFLPSPSPLPVPLLSDRRAQDGKAKRKERQLHRTWLSEKKMWMTSKYQCIFHFTSKKKKKKFCLKITSFEHEDKQPELSCYLRSHLLFQEHCSLTIFQLPLLSKSAIQVPVTQKVYGGGRSQSEVDGGDMGYLETQIPASAWGKDAWLAGVMLPLCWGDVLS